MASNAVHKVSDLPPDEAIARLLGRSLEPGEHISVMAYRPHKAPEGAERAEIVERLEESIWTGSRRASKICPRLNSRS